ncbi:alpha/beta-hydrolase [Panus rudis PR-1116 ss-1]|nr:alpha/beta-hydrolase [Panus rudis PR-1116 ss-1]
MSNVSAYFATPNGKVRYWLNGPENGTKVVLIHGISLPSITWQKMVEFLAARNFRVLTYDLHGRGYSEAPETLTNTTNLYITQLALLMQYIGWESARIVGFSMGGGICAAFSSFFPHLINGRIVLVASAGLMEANLPQVSDSTGIPAELRRLQTELLPGYDKIIKYDLHNGPISGLHWAFKSLDKLKMRNGLLKVMIIHGTDDHIVPHNESRKIKELIPGAEVVDVEGATHYLVMREGHWQKVAESILCFFGSGSE